MHVTPYMCTYSSGPEAFAARDPPGGGRAQAHAAKASSPLEYIHMYSVSCMRWSILANAPINFDECGCPFYQMRLYVLANVSRYSGIQAFRYSGVQVVGYSVIQVFRYPGIQVFRYSGIRVISYSGIQVYYF